MFNCCDADIIEDLYSPRTASMDFVTELVRKRGKDNLHKFIQFIVEIFKRYSFTHNVGHVAHCDWVHKWIHLDCFLWSRYDESPAKYKPYRQKDGALLAIGSLCDKLKQTEPYKSELERMLVQHVFPEFSSPIGHLRAKVGCFCNFIASISDFHNSFINLIRHMLFTLEPFNSLECMLHIWLRLNFKYKCWSLFLLQYLTTDR